MNKRFLTPDEMEERKSQEGGWELDSEDSLLTTFSPDGEIIEQKIEVDGAMNKDFTDAQKELLEKAMFNYDADTDLVDAVASLWGTEEGREFLRQKGRDYLAEMEVND